MTQAGSILATPLQVPQDRKEAQIMLKDEPSAEPAGAMLLKKLWEFLARWKSQHTAVLTQLVDVTILLNTRDLLQSEAVSNEKKKEDLSKQEDFLRNKVDEYERLIAAHTSIAAKEGMNAPDDIELDKATLYPSIPRFGKKHVHYSLPEGASVFTSPLEFLEEFAIQVRRKYSEKNMERLYARLLILAILDDVQQSRVDWAITKLPKEDRSRHKSEQLFIETLLTPYSLFEQASIAIARGRPPHESYQQYARTLERLVRICRIDESPYRGTLLMYMKATVPSQVYTSMNLYYMIDYRTSVVKVPDRSEVYLIDTAALFIRYLERIEGPDDCDDRKSVQAALDNIRAMDRSIKRAHTAGPDLMMCDNSCGISAFHNTASCVVCHSCKRRGHIARHCKTGMQASLSSERAIQATRCSDFENIALAPRKNRRAIAKPNKRLRKGWIVNPTHPNDDLRAKFR
ncbi:hypothetical protein DFQ27_003044 [Actinomortierella ambigua]|uniref:CCHC-type domain-containing protein n=1 Tax=Actinomortierella ambigua TaxID=1343610 RepID=A0A9P6Q8R7_9FUNG|nr:hypothetical protein DFQ27_003044 [Actinomortierella ambigua]